MDTTLERVRCASMLSTAISIVYEASHHAREARRLELSVQLENLVEELIYLHREVLDLPPQRTPAACEFERAELPGHDEFPF